MVRVSRAFSRIIQFFTEKIGSLRGRKVKREKANPEWQAVYDRTVARDIGIKASGKFKGATKLPARSAKTQKKTNDFVVGQRSL